MLRDLFISNMVKWHRRLRVISMACSKFIQKRKKIKDYGINAHVFLFITIVAPPAIL